MKGKHPGGRPSKFDTKYCKGIVDYFESFRSLEVPRCPLFEMYAANIGVHKNTLLTWCKDYPEFLCAYEKARAIQLDIMANNAFIGVFNPGFTKFALQNMHGWSDKQELDHKSSDGSMTPKTIADFYSDNAKSKP